MNLNRFVFFGCVLLFFGCYQFEAPDKPDNLIPEDKMIDILIDAKLIGISNSANKKVMRDSGINPDNYIFKKYNIDSLQFAQSNDYYAYYIDDYESIYTKINDSLNVLLKDLKDRQEEERKANSKRRRDSINAVRAKKDSINRAKKIKDSLANLKKKEVVKEQGLIPPVSDNSDQPQK
ncbi:DUF4296 domain-containing protein [Gaetbulibacter aestuarii]|uniref:DUF4296 domain-containing protein n=1 Tax=Gaetbulibacter aestuarii TaxID=1502358 RepID=A0ABW7MX81_9FLAO